jgi:predicted NBD/HSP70 family sugar kinase
MKWGIDLGGTKIEGIVFAEDPEVPQFRGRIPTEQEGGYDRVLKNLVAMVEHMAAETGLAIPDQIGIGTPGTTDPATGLVKNANTQCLLGMPLVADLSDALGIEIVAANDANCFALAEAAHGIAVKYPTVFGIIMGTGVGGGLVVKGKVLNGAQGIAGEWGHNVLDPNGNLAYSGHRGIVESVLSGPALERFYFDCTGISRPLAEIATRNQDLAAIRTIDRLCEQFGKAVAQVVNVFDPHAIVLGGGVSNLDVLYSRGPAEVAKWVFNYEFSTPILRAKLGDSAGVIGAAMLV